ncbi:CPBP family intramembrane glutamic endopeptidase, partial [Phycicoccus flavus]
LPRLQTVTGPRRGAVLTGALHGGIHLPLILLATTYDTDGPRWSAAVGAVLTITGAGVVYAWLRGRSGSLWPVALAHGTANTVFDVAAVAVVPTGAGGLALVAGETGVATWLVCGLAAAVLLSRSPVWDRPAARPSPAPAAAAGSDRAPAGV